MSPESSNPQQGKPAVDDAAQMLISAITRPAPRHTTYTFEAALAAGAFDQLDLITHLKFADLAKSRGIELHSGTLEWLDKRGALRPIGFLTTDGVPALHGKRFNRWRRYRRKVWGMEEVDALYSPWQLLYLDAAVNGRYVRVDIAGLRDRGVNLTPRPRSLWRSILERHLREWRQLDESWRSVILVLVRIQNRYYPAVRGTVTLKAGEDPFRREVASFDPEAVAVELGWTHDEIKSLYEWLSFQGKIMDPAKEWFPIFRSLSHREQEKFKGTLRRAHDFYDAAAMLRRWYRDLTGEILPDSDEVGTFPAEWRPNWLGHERRMTYDRKDMQRLLEMHGAYPNRVHVLVEGETEEAVLEELILAFRNTEPSALGVKIEPFAGVGNVTDRLLQISSYAREAVLVADNEGDLARTVKALQARGELENLHLRLCDKNFEEDNLSVEELIDVARVAASAQGVAINISADQLRQRLAMEQQARGSNARGLASILVGMLQDPSVGPVVLSKVDLGRHIARFLLDTLTDAEDQQAAIETRPILKLAGDIVRVTGR